MEAEIKKCAGSCGLIKHRSHFSTYDPQYREYKRCNFCREEMIRRREDAKNHGTTWQELEAKNKALDKAIEKVEAAVKELALLRGNKYTHILVKLVLEDYPL